MGTLLCVLCAAALCCGCRTKRDVPRVGTEGTCPPLSAEEADFSKALAHYAGSLTAGKESSPDDQARLEHLKKSVELDPRNYRLRLLLGQACEAGKKFSEAQAAFLEAVRLEPDKPQAYILCAWSHSTQGNHAEAVALLRKATRRTGARGAVISYCAMLGNLYFLSSHVDQAVPYYRLAADCEPQDVSVRMRLATCYLLQNNDRQAMAALSEAAAVSPGDARIPVTRGYILMLQDRYGDAVSEFGKAEKIAGESGIDPKTLNPAFYFWFGAACERMGRIEDAERHLQKCIELHPDTHQAYNYLAYMWAERGVNLEKALNYVNKALESEPDNGAYIDTLGWIYYKQGRHGKALEKMEEAKKAVPDDATITDHLGDICLALGKEKEAVGMWKESFVLDPSQESVGRKLRERGVDVEGLRREAKPKKAAASAEKSE